jgi:integrase
LVILIALTTHRRDGVLVSGIVVGVVSGRAVVRPLGEVAGRLATYGARYGVIVTPHQLRHSCATLLLNAGAPVLMVQTILGHKHVDTTLLRALV